METKLLIYINLLLIVQIFSIGDTHAKYSNERERIRK